MKEFIEEYGMSLFYCTMGLLMAGYFVLIIGKMSV